MTKEKYFILRDKLTTASCPEYILNILKEHFRQKIDSDRRFDRIINLLNLIQILEKRDVVSPENIIYLRYIAQRLDRADIIELINNFNAAPVPEVQINNENNELINNFNAAPIPEVQRNNDNNVRVLPRIDSDPIMRVYNLICMEIGQKWKDFARALKVPEGFIDQLELIHRNRISEMVREIITYHRDQCDARYWRVQLSNGLVNARRRDLSQAVENVFAMHGL